MQLDFDNIEQQIAEHKAKIEFLEEQKQKAELRKQGLIAFDKALVNLAAEYKMEEHEFYDARGGDIVEWLLGQLNNAEAPEYISTLKARVARVVKREEGGAPKRVSKANGKAAKAPEPKLEVGSYRNPYTKNVIEKKKRNPKELNEWVEKYGLKIVQGWKFKPES
ncbi:hypothetical protein [Biformimicrobium ophioploci]|uniref:MvaT DNA-binding domain-containing protein n=1 Tax=Biformimicrobium ophioploci TaxID=3036711 RepID=A0ABQ6M0Z7_9GAMM|nr:hypothetical protein [Microbulbifer sp. NKW57]GMG87981.1 hypothetical protein MNKW57_23020 [Microbulbifer sp. NKW57]